MGNDTAYGCIGTPTIQVHLGVVVDRERKRSYDFKFYGNRIYNYVLENKCAFSNC